MKKNMLNTKKYFTTTQLEAQSIITEYVQLYGPSVKKQTITKRQKATKEELIEYYIIDITIENYTIKDLI